MSEEFTENISDYNAPTEFMITKANLDKQIIIGIVSVSTLADGTPYYDSEGDFIPPEELINMAEYYLENGGLFDINHDSMLEDAPNIDAKVVQSFVIEPEICKRLGLISTIYGCAWVLAVHIINPELWQSVLDGNFRSFSIGGSAIRIPIEGDINEN